MLESALPNKTTHRTSFTCCEARPGLYLDVPWSRIIDRYTNGYGLAEEKHSVRHRIQANTGSPGGDHAGKASKRWVFGSSICRKSRFADEGIYIAQAAKEGGSDGTKKK